MHNPDRPVELRIGATELIVRQRYVAASIANDILIALWFITGSVLFFSPAWETPGVWCFLFGSVELLIRPVIRLSRHLHLQRLHGPRQAAPEDAQDF